MVQSWSVVWQWQHSQINMSKSQSDKVVDAGGVELPLSVSFASKIVSCLQSVSQLRSGQGLVGSLTITVRDCVQCLLGLLEILGQMCPQNVTFWSLHQSNLVIVIQSHELLTIDIDHLLILWIQLLSH